MSKTNSYLELRDENQQPCGHVLLTSNVEILGIERLREEERPKIHDKSSQNTRCLGIIMGRPLQEHRDIFGNFEKDVSPVPNHPIVGGLQWIVLANPGLKKQTGVLLSFAQWLHQIFGTGSLYLLTDPKKIEVVLSRKFGNRYKLEFDTDPPKKHQDNLIMIGRSANVFEPTDGYETRENRVDNMERNYLVDLFRSLNFASVPSGVLGREVSVSLTLSPSYVAAQNVQGAQVVRAAQSGANKIDTENEATTEIKTDAEQGHYEEDAALVQALSALTTAVESVGNGLHELLKVLRRSPTETKTV